MTVVSLFSYTGYIPLESYAADTAPVATIGNDIRSYFSDPNNDSITSNLQLSFQDSKGQPVTDPTIDSVVNFSTDITIPNNITPSIHGGDYYDIILPTTVAIQQGVKSVPLYDDNDVEYGIFDVDPDPSGKTGGLVHITFTDAVTTAGTVTGDLHFQGSLSTTGIDHPGDTQIVIPSEDNLTADINVKPQTNSTIEKNGVTDANHSPNNITWTVIANKSLSTLTGAKVTDTFPAHLLPPSVVVKKVSVDLYGNLVPGSESAPLTEGTDYTYDTNAPYGVTFNGTISDAYEVIYTTGIDKNSLAETGGTYSFTNNAYLTSNEVTTPAAATSTVNANFGSALDKISVGTGTETIPGQSPAKRQTFSWQLRYNYNAASVPAANASVTDIYDPNLYYGDPGAPADYGHVGFNPASVQIYPVSFDANGNPVQSATPIDSSLYTVIELNEPTGGAFTIKFNSDVTIPYNIAYSTYATGFDAATPEPDDDPNGIVVSNYPVVNTAKRDDTGVTAGATTNVKQQGIIKQLTKIDTDSKILSWQAELNADRYSSAGLVYTDRLDSTHNLDPSTLVVTDMTASPHKILVAGTDYTYAMTQTSPEIFTITFIGAYNPTNHELRVTYNSVYQADASNGPFVNSATSNWTTNDKPYESHDTSSYTPTPIDDNNGQKSGSYNAVTKTITWDVPIGYANTPLKNATITDNIVSPNSNQLQVYIPTSLHIYHYTVTPATGAIVRGAELSAAEYGTLTIDSPDSNPGSTAINIKFPDTVTQSGLTPEGRYLVEYQTSLVGQDIAPSYTNSAILHNDNSVDHELTATVSPNHGGNLVEKSGSQGTSDGYMYWNVTINPSQSTTSNVVVTDTPRSPLTKPADNNSAQTIQTDTIAVYPTIVNEKGVLTSDTSSPLVLGTDYTYTYAPNPVTGALELIVSLIGNYQTIDRAYVLSFRASLMLNTTASTGTQIHNDVTINSDNNSHMDNDYQSYTTVKVQDAGGVLKGSLTSFTINKLTADTKQPMDGVLFGLFDAKGNLVQIQQTTDANGQIKFNNIATGTYKLREFSNGHWVTYAVSDALFVGQNINVTKNGSATITNSKGKVQLQKTDVNGNALSGATFDLEEYVIPDGADAPIWQLVSQSGIDTRYTSNVNGFITVTGLAKGEDYRFIETDAPDGYILNTSPVAFTLGSDLVSSVVNLTSVNVQGALRITKTMNSGGVGGDVTLPPDLEGQPVAGARFILTDTNPTTPGITNPSQFNILRDITTGPDGLVSFSGITPGAYWIAEMQPPPGFVEVPGLAYVLPVSIPAVISDASEAVIYPQIPTGDGSMRDTWPNFLHGTVIFFNKSDDVGNPLGGATYKLIGPAPLGAVNDAGQVVSPDAFTTIEDTASRTGIVTNDSGLGTISRATPGAYYLEETSAPQGYVLDPTPHYFKVTNAAVAIYHVNTSQSAFVNYKGTAYLQKTDAQGNPLSDAAFTIYNDSGNAVQTATTDANGIATFAGLDTGTYTVKETKAPEGYLINDAPISPFAIVTSATGNPAAVEITNTDGDNPINYKGSVVFTKTAVDGTILSGFAFALQDTQTGAFVMPGSVSASDSFGDYFLSDADGNVSVSGLSPGKYLFTEIGYLTGGSILSGPGVDYLVNQTASHAFTITSHAVGVPDAVLLDDFINYQGSAYLTKVNEHGEPLSGAAFTLCDENYVALSGVRAQTISSNEDGIVTFEGLAPGVYTVRETTTPLNYIINTASLPAFTVADAADSTPAAVRIVGLDGDNIVNYKGTLKFNKTMNFQGGEAGGAMDNLPLPGAEFTLYYSDPTVFGANPISETAISDADGNVVFSNLPPGDDYWLSETGIPLGFWSEMPAYWGQIVVPNTISTSTQAIVSPFQDLVDPDGDVNDGDNLVENFTDSWPNLLVSTTAFFYKSGDAPVRDAAAAGADANFVSTSAVVDPNSPLADPLGGAVYSLYTSEGGVVSTTALRTGITTNANGIGAISGLDPGDYRLIETNAPAGYIVNETPIDFTIPVDEPYRFYINEYTSPAINYQGDAYLVKTNTSDEPLSGAEFELYNVNDTGTAIQTGTSNDAGFVTFASLAPGEYIVKEIVAPVGYLIDDEQLPSIIITNTALGTPAPVRIVTSDTNDNVYNYKGSVQFTKTAAVTTTALSGFAFSLTNTDTFETITPGAVGGDTAYDYFVSNAEGIVSVGSLAPGNYEFNEVGYVADGNLVIGSGGAFLLNRYAQDFEISTHAIAEHTEIIIADPFINYQGSAYLTKADAEGNPLSGAGFTIYNASGDEYQIATSDALGIVTFTGLAPGEYSVSETSAPDGYLINDAPIPNFNIILSDYGEPNPVWIRASMAVSDVVDYQGSAYLKKTDVDGNAIENVVFTLYDTLGDGSQGTGLFTDVTNELGLVTFAGLTPGAYIVKETLAPIGYIQNASPIAITIDGVASGIPTPVQITGSDADENGNIINYQGGLRMTKTMNNPLSGYPGGIVTQLPNGMDGQPLAGARFILTDSVPYDDVYHPEGITNPALLNVLRETVTGPDGLVSFSGITPGAYYLVEMTPPPSFVEVVGLAYSLPVTIPAVINTSGESIIYPSVEGWTVAGGASNVWPNFLHDTALFFYKSDASGNALAGAEYSIFGPVPLGAVSGSSQADWSVVSPAAFEDVASHTGIKTNINGIGMISYATTGAYYLQETKAPAGYVLDPTPHYFKVGETEVTPSMIVNSADDPYINYKGVAYLTKTDVDGNAISGAEFTLYSASATDEAIQVVTSNDAGLVTFAGLTPGAYTVKETAAPVYVVNNVSYPAYIINTADIPEFIISDTAIGTPEAVQINDNADGNPDNDAIINYKGNVSFSKVDSAGDELSGYAYSLTKTDSDETITPSAVVGGDLSYDYFVSDADGLVSVSGLAPGSYEFNEVGYASGGSILSGPGIDYLVNLQPIDFVISHAAVGTDTAIVLDDFVNYQGSAYLTKTDASGHLLSGAEYTIYRTVDTDTAIEVVTTGALGIATFTGLAPGDYVVIETKAPDGYIINDTDIPAFTITSYALGAPDAIKINDNGDDDPDNDAILNYKGSAAFIKQNESGEWLSGYAFNLVNQDTGEVITPGVLAANGTIDDPSDDVPNGITTDYFVSRGDDGVVLAENIPVGNYEFVEIGYVSGESIVSGSGTEYVINTTPIEFSITNHAVGDPDRIWMGEHINYKGAAYLLKTNSNGDPLDGAVFTLTDASGNVVQTVASDVGGFVTFAGLAPGVYTAQEIAAPDGYIINDAAIPAITIPASADDAPNAVQIVASEDEGGGSIVNYKGVVLFSKVNEANQALPGYAFILKNEDTGAVITPEELGDVSSDMGNADENYVNALHTYFVSDGDGDVSAAGLEPGDYEFDEVGLLEPDGRIVSGEGIDYIINTEPLEFEVSAHAVGLPEVIDPSDFTNYQGSIALEKIDGNGNPLSGAVFTLYDSADTQIGTYTTPTDGIIFEDGLTPGDYYFVETKAPSGYDIPTVTKYGFTVAGAESGDPGTIQIQVVNNATPPTVISPPSVVKPVVSRTTPSSTTPPVRPRTGDDMNLTQIYLLLILSVSLTVLLAVAKRREFAKRAYRRKI
jgi:uncharacterized surface anchored protein